jgi:hypothetical protein
MMRMDDLENRVTSMEETFETRVATLEETFRQTFAEFRQTLTEEFAKVRCEPEKSPALSVAEETVSEYRMAVKKVELPLFDDEDPVGWITRVETYFEVQGRYVGGGEDPTC